MSVFRITVNRTIDHWVIADRIQDTFGYVGVPAGNTETRTIEFEKMLDNNIQITIKHSPIGENEQTSTYTLSKWVELYGEHAQLLGIMNRKSNPDPKVVISSITRRKSK